MTLADSRKPSRCRVLDIAPDSPGLHARFCALGLYPGAIVEVLRFAPMGDPVQLRVGGTLISVRRSEARLIAVEALV